MEFKPFGLEELNRVKAIYQEMNWQTYLKDDEMLVRAFEKSLEVFGAFDDEQLIGFVRCIGDGEHSVVVQDLIVSKAYQKRGIGTSLFQKIWDKYAHVRMFHVVTDLTDDLDNHFYQSFGMKTLEEGHMVSYFREDRND